MSYQYQAHSPNACLSTLESALGAFGFADESRLSFATHAPYDLATGNLVIGHNRLNGVERSEARLDTLYIPGHGLTLDIGLEEIPTDGLLVAEASRFVPIALTRSVGRILVGVSDESFGMSFVDDFGSVDVEAWPFDAKDRYVDFMVRSLTVHATRKIIGHYESLDG